MSESERERDRVFELHQHLLSEEFSSHQRKQITRIPNVKGTAIGLRQHNGEFTDECALVVYVNRKYDEDDLEAWQIIPESVEVDGEIIPTDVRAVGVPQLDAGAPSRREEIRPIAGGIEVGRNAVGTCTAKLYGSDGTGYLITARHVLQGSSDNTDLSNGDEMFQPDGGEAVGEVVRSSGMYFGGTRKNLLDASLIELYEDGDASGEYLGWGHALGITHAQIGDRVICFSASAGMCTGEVIAIGAETEMVMPWSGSAIAVYANMIEYNWESEPGSSGAAVGIINPDTRQLHLVGLHVGSSDGTAFMAPWSRVEYRFGELEPA